MVMWMTQFAEICEIKVHSNTVDSSELDQLEAIGFHSNFHNGLVIGAKFWLRVGERIVDGAVYLVEIHHKELIAAVFNKVNGGPGVVQDRKRETQLILGPS